MTYVVGVGAVAEVASFLQGDDAGSVVEARHLKMRNQQHSEYSHQLILWLVGEARPMIVISAVHTAKSRHTLFSS